MKKKRCVLCYAVLAVCFALLLAVSVGTGSAALSPHEILRILLLREGAGTAAYNVLLKIRLPRVLAAAVMGGTLSVSGFLLQTFFRNPIAGPYVLGVSSGAKLAVGAVMIFGMKLWGRVPFGAVMTAAFVGAMLCASFVMIVSRKIHSMAMLLVVGMMIGNVCSAATDFFVTFAKESDIANLTSWSMGSFSGMTWANVGAAACVVLPALAAAFLLSKPMAAYQMGESYARSVGVPVRAFSTALVLLSSLLSACVTAFAGPISFVGIAVPHLVRTLMGTSKPILVIPGCFLGGAVFCLFCDLVARTVFAPVEMSISSVTALFGAPIVIYMMVRRQSKAM